MKPGDIGVRIQRLAGLRVTETPGELYRFYPLLVPEGGATVAEAVGREVERPHGGADLVPVHLKRKVALTSGDKEAWGVDDAALPLPLSEFASKPNPFGDRVYVGGSKRQCFRHTRTQLLHDDQGQAIARLHTFKDGDDLIVVGWMGLDAYYAWKLDAPVPRDIHDTGEVQHHAQLADEQTDGTGSVLGVEDPHPLYDLWESDLVHRRAAERVEENRLAEPVARERAVRYVPPTGEPFFVHLSEPGFADDGSFELALWIFRGGKAVRYEVTPQHGFAFGPEGSTVLYLRVPAPAPVADVESAAVPGVPRTNVKGGHQ